MTNQIMTRWRLKYVRPALEQLQSTYTSTELDALIAIHIDSNPDGHGVTEAVTREGYVPVWSLIGYIEGAQGDLDDVATGFCISTDAVRAALAFYGRFRQAILARLLVNNSDLVEVSD